MISRPASFEDECPASHYGGKCAALSTLLRAGLPVPAGYGLAPDLSEAIAIGEELARRSVSGMVDRLGGVVAVRSSGLGEDGTHTSFAGQHASFLGITSDDGLIDAVCKVVASAQTQSATAYRDAMKIAQSDQIAVIVQRLARPDSAGVLFTRNPVSNADELVIEAVLGLGESLVSGHVTPSSFRLDRTGKILSREPSFQDFRLDFVPGSGVDRFELAEDQQEQLILSEKNLSDLHQLADTCEQVFGGPQDIEWCIEQDTVSLLQARPITTLSD